MIDPLIYFLWCLFAIEMLLLAAYNGWLEWMLDLRILRPFYTAWDWLIDRTNRLFDAITRRLP